MPDPDALRLSEAAWRQRLSATASARRARKAPKPQGSSALNAEKRKSSTAQADLPLFSSDAKYDSGTGWPSFHTRCLARWPRRPTEVDPAAHRVSLRPLRWPPGHVFDDGPGPAASATATTAWH
ncbi:MAG: peptide-methionine (R)-S-oxide reductase [Piscinibacter sp.]|nr:peptide-methionine (R)-S-oxide reductase [Piscinibacter sp.]